ncbi:short-chain dehydrogenase protein [Rutstroemia sp. NJR-2017a WRK4]|nr:short-chain dehydrogenase protein [Rutstroemia sp. NJR-2017a WRK4]
MGKKHFNVFAPFRAASHSIQEWVVDINFKRVVVFPAMSFAKWSRAKFQGRKPPDKHSTVEHPKIPLDDGCRSIWINCMLHLSPLAITTIIVYLNLAFTYWGDASVEDTWRNNLLNMLQFAAKVHELCVGASIAAIVAHFTVLMLCRRNGLPFWLLGADIQVGSFNLFFKRSFWSIWGLQRHGFKLDVISFTLFLVFCSLLAAFSGPSSAIAIHPNLDWWQVKNVTLDFEYQTKVEIWPMNLVDDSTVRLNINCTKTIYASLDPIYCPASGLNQVTLNLMSINPILPRNPLNATFDDLSGQTSRLLTSSLLEEENAHSYSSSLSLVPQMVMAELWLDITAGMFRHPAISQPKFVTHPKTLIKKPLVQVKCNVYENYNSIVSSPATSQPIFPFIPSLTSPHSKELEPQGYPVPSYTFTGPDHDGYSLYWVNLYENNCTASLGIVIKVPYARHDSNTVTQDSLIVPCTFDARWISTQLSFDPTSTSVINDKFSDAGAFSKLGQHILKSNGTFAADSGTSVSEVINIDPEWAKLVNPIDLLPFTAGDFNGTIPISKAPPYNTTMLEETLQLLTTPDSNDTVSFNYLQAIYETQNATSLWGNRTYEPADTQKFLSILLGMVMTDGIARYGMAEIITSDHAILGYHTTLRNSDSSSSPVETPARASDNWHKWRFVVWRRGYSYGARDITTKLALSVLITHAALAIGFMIYLWVSGWTTNSWTTIGELVALALRSKSTEKFRGTDAGIGRQETWTQNVRIREMDEGGLEMRFGFDGEVEERGMGVEKVAVGRKYGAGEVKKQIVV